MVCALPNLINRITHEEDFKNIAKLLDQMTDFMDQNFLDDGCVLFNDEARDEQFASRLRSMHGRVGFRGEAFTVIRQQLGMIKDVTGGKCNFEPTEHHV